MFMTLRLCMTVALLSIAGFGKSVASGYKLVIGFFAGVSWRVFFEFSARDECPNRIQGFAHVERLRARASPFGLLAIASPRSYTGRGHRALSVQGGY